MWHLYSRVRLVNFKSPCTRRTISDRHTYTLLAIQTRLQLIYHPLACLSHTYREEYHQNGRYRYGAIRPHHKTRRESRPSSYHPPFGSPWRDRAIPIEPDFESTVGLSEGSKADGRYELVKETNMVDYVESLFNAAKEAGAQVEGIGQSTCMNTKCRG